MKKLPTQWWDWPSVALFFMMTITASARLLATDWTPKLGLAQTAALLGCILGLALGYSHFKRSRVWLIITGYTLVILPWLWLKIIESKESTLQRLASVGGRLSVAINEIATHRPVEDFIFFVALMTVLFWVISIYGGYQLTRKGNLLAAIIPAGLGIVIIELYDFLEPQRILYLGTYLLLSLILLGRHNLLNNNVLWRESNMATSSDISIDITTGLVVASVAVLIAAWLVPLNGIAFEPVARTWHEFDQQFDSTRQRIKDALASLENYTPGSVGTGFGSELSLGRSAAQGEIVLFTVQAPSGISQRYYWRARFYDTYNTGQWTNVDASEKPFSPEETSAFVPLDPITEKITSIFIVNQPQSTLITVNDPLWASRAATVTFAYTGTTATDLVTLRAKDIIRKGERYEVRSAVRAPTIVELRNAGTDYPGWLKQRYLQLPKSLTPRLADLAERITANAETPYDKAEAITDYLRANISYTDTIHSVSPLGSDPIEWMLFESKEGFCNYYASAEVLMLRAVGVPARMAAGYAEGEIIDATTYQVRNKDSHAWPEVYFPGIGWVEFEPTSAQPSLARPSGSTAPIFPGGASQPTPPGSEGGHEPIEDGNAATPVTNSSQLIRLVMLWVIIFIIGGAWAGFLIYLNRRQPLSVRIPRALEKIFTRYHFSVPRWLQDWLRWTEQTQAERAFETINLCLRILGKPQPIHATPSERAAVLISILPDATAAIEQLTQQHIGALFSPTITASNNIWQNSLSIYFILLRRYFRSAR